MLPTRFADLDPRRHPLPAEVAESALSPALLVWIDLVRENVRRVLAHCGGDPDRWRPHVKTTKIPAVWAELPRAGLRTFKCATTREASLLLDVLEREGVPDGDVLVAYPHVGPALARLGVIASEHPTARLSVLVECPEVLRTVPDTVDVYVDLNPGMNRTGVPMAREEVVRQIAAEAGGRFRGLHYYDGHLHDPDLAARRREAHAGYDELLALVARLEAEGIVVGELVTSGTPAFLHALAHPGLSSDATPRHRVSPGTVVYHDLRSEQDNPDLDLVPAALVHSRIVSHPTNDLATCDAGSKSIAAEAGDPCAFVLGHADWTARTPNEEHLPLHVPAGELPPRGTGVLLVPMHVCPTINLAEEAILIEGGSVREIAPVSARAHELVPTPR